MSNYVNTTIETREAEVNYIVEIHKDMRDNCKYWYTNSYDFSNGDRVKITVEKKKNWATAVTVAESEDNMKTILELAKENNINKVCIDGEVCDIRQLNKQPFKIVPIKTDIMKNTIFYEPMLFAWTK